MTASGHNEPLCPTDDTARGRLAGLANVHLLEPVDYPAAIWLLRHTLTAHRDERASMRWTRLSRN